MPITDELIEALSVEIARAFAIEDIQRIMLKTTGKDLFGFWVGPGKPVKDTAFDLLQAVSREGVERIVLAEMLARRRTDDKLGALIDKACPEAREAMPATGKQVEVLITGLDAVRARLADPAVRERLALSVDRLKQIVDTIDSLHAYKSLHECLHQLQAKQFGALKEAARKLPTEPDQAMELFAYRNQLRTACLIARQTVTDLPDTPVLRATETLWIEVLETAGEQFHDAIDAEDSNGARSALRKIRSIMVTDPPRLNRLIFTTATALPLDELIGALADVGGGAVAEITAALASLRVIASTIRAGVVEHREWQDADIRIGELDQLLEREGPDLIEEFASEWVELKAIVLDLAGREPDAKWAGKIRTYIDNVEDALAAETDNAPFRFAYDNFRGEAQFRFLAVDSRLKADCAALVKIGLPLHRILEELEQ